MHINKAPADNTSTSIYGDIHDIHDKFTSLRNKKISELKKFDYQFSQVLITYYLHNFILHTSFHLVLNVDIYFVYLFSVSFPYVYIEIT